MVKGWTSSSDGRHHGAHYAEAAQVLGTGSDAFLDFSQNINPLGPPRVALAAAEKALHEEAGRYPDLDYAQLRSALAGYLGVPPAAVLPTNGGAEALFLAARVAVEGPGSRAIILEPTFSEYAAAARAAGLEAEHVIARRPETGFRLDLAILDEALGERGDVGIHHRDGSEVAGGRRSRLQLGRWWVDRSEHARRTKAYARAQQLAAGPSARSRAH